MKNNAHIGSNFDDFLEKEGLLAQTGTVAVKRVLAFELQQKMKTENLSFTRLAKDLNTSRAALSRIFDTHNSTITLQTMEKVAQYVGKRLVLSLD